MNANRMTNIEREHEIAVKQFFARCVAEKRITSEEVRNLSRPRPDWKTYAAWIEDIADQNGTAVDDVRVFVKSRLGAVGLRPVDAEMWLNYPQFDEAGIADRLGMARQSVNERLAKIRTAWPSLRLETAMCQHDEAPDLTRMRRIEMSSNSDARLNDAEVIKL